MPTMLNVGSKSGFSWQNSSGEDRSVMASVMSICFCVCLLDIEPEKRRHSTFSRDVHHRGDSVPLKHMSFTEKYMRIPSPTYCRDPEGCLQHDTSLFMSKDTGKPTTVNKLNSMTNIIVLREHSQLSSNNAL